MICEEKEGGKFSFKQTGFEGGACGLAKKIGSHQHTGGNGNHSNVCPAIVNNVPMNMNVQKAF